MPAIQALHPKHHKALQCNNGQYPLSLYNTANLLPSSLASKDVITHKQYPEAASDLTGCKTEGEWQEIVSGNEEWMELTDKGDPKREALPTTIGAESSNSGSGVQTPNRSELE